MPLLSRPCSPAIVCQKAEPIWLPCEIIIQISEPLDTGRNPHALTGLEVDLDRNGGRKVSHMNSIACRVGPRLQTISRIIGSIRYYDDLTVSMVERTMRKQGQGEQRSRCGLGQSEGEAGRTSRNKHGSGVYKHSPDMKLSDECIKLHSW